jgi:hypothetical protein
MITSQFFCFIFQRPYRYLFISSYFFTLFLKSYFLRKNLCAIRWGDGSTGWDCRRRLVPSNSSCPASRMQTFISAGPIHRTIPVFVDRYLLCSVLEQQFPNRETMLDFCKYLENWTRVLPAQTVLLLLFWVKSWVFTQNYSASFYAWFTHFSCVYHYSVRRKLLGFRSAK